MPRYESSNRLRATGRARLRFAKGSSIHAFYIGKYLHR